MEVNQEVISSADLISTGILFQTAGEAELLRLRPCGQLADKVCAEQMILGDGTVHGRLINQGSEISRLRSIKKFIECNNMETVQLMP